MAAASGAFPVAVLTLVTEAIRLRQAKLSWLEGLAIAGPAALAIGLIGCVMGVGVVALGQLALSRLRWTWSQWCACAVTVLLSGSTVYWLSKATHRFLVAGGTRAIAAAWLFVPALLGILFFARVIERRVAARTQVIPNPTTLTVVAAVAGAVWAASFFVTDREVFLAVGGMDWLPLVMAGLAGIVATAYLAVRHRVLIATAVCAVVVLVFAVWPVGPRDARMEAAVAEQSRATRLMFALGDRFVPEGAAAPLSEGAGTCRPGVTQAPANSLGKVGRGAPNILLITFDGVRWDHTSLAGYERDTTPNLKRWAKKGVVFERAYSNSASTRQTFRSLLTGLLPSQLAPSRGSNRWAVSFAPDQLTIASYLAAAGYQTISIQSSGAVDEVEAKEFRGFQVRDLTPHKRLKELGYSSSSHIDRVIAQLSEGAADQPRFIFSHLMDAHKPFIPGPQPKRWGNKEADRYDSAIHNVDRQLGRMIDFVMSPEHRGNTLLILAADHGAGLDERGSAGGHGNSLYESMTRVPLLFFGKGVKPTRVARPVSLLDLFQTILDAAGLESAPHACGESLLPVVKGEEKYRARPVISEIFPDKTNENFKISLVENEHKLMIDARKGVTQLFNLQSDPAESQDLAQTDPAQLEKMRSSLREFLTAHAREPKDYGL
jgi:arylsulfatase A-like enzyme